METNGNGANSNNPPHGNDPELPGFNFDAVEAELVEMGKAVIETVASGEMAWSEALMLMGLTGGALGYEQCRQDLLARLSPIKLKVDAESVVTLEGKEALDMMASLGLNPGNQG